MSAFLEDIKSYLITRLQVFDPTIDVSTGSPIETEVVDPLISRLGTDPFEINILDFITQRLTEQFPELAIDVGELQDLVVNPLITLLEPFKQELTIIANNQSINNADLMNDDEMDALGANWFETRNEGNISSGTARLYFSSPRNVVISTTKTIQSKSGLIFYPVVDTTITSAQLLFNREGDLYFLDINVEAESPGEEYNIDKQELISIDDVEGVVKITNLRPFSGGLPRESNTEFKSRIEQALTERSLVTKRGVFARSKKLFDALRTLQVIGAGEEGMNRDILEGGGQGFLHLSGVATAFGSWLLIKNVYFKDLGPLKNLTISPGDIVKYENVLDPNRTIVEAKVVRIFWTSGDYSLFEVDFFFGYGVDGYIALFKPGFITISKVPGGMLSTSVPDKTVHLGGHSDIFIRPSDDRVETATINNISNNKSILNLIKGKVTAGSNEFETELPDPLDLSIFGIQVGDTLTILTGTQSGTYKIIELGSTLRLDNIFSASENNLHCVISNKLIINLNEPVIIKLPFNIPVNDLKTIIGSSILTLTSTNIQNFGAVVGDTIEILTGPDAGKYTIIGFDTFLGGQGPIVDRPASATSVGLGYKVYNAQSGLIFPHVRITKIEQLDSSNQGTGVTVPYGDTVDIRVSCDFEYHKKVQQVLDKKLFFMPDLSGYWDSLPDDFATPAANVDARYTQRIVSADGHVRKIDADALNPIIQSEINIPPFTWDGQRNTVLALTTMKDYEFTSDPSDNARTSPLVKSEIGDIVTILNTPNAGSYLISDPRVIDLWNRTTEGHSKIGLIKFDRQLPTDPIRSCLEFIFAGFILGSGVLPVTGIELLKIFEYSTDWSNINGFFEDILIPRLRDTLIYFSFPATTSLVREMLYTISFSGYSTGDAPRGVLRAYFLDPVGIDLFTDSKDPTLFKQISDGKLARIDTNIIDGQIYPPSFEDQPIFEWARDAVMKYPTDTSLFINTVPSFVKRGVRSGDTLEFYPAINDVKARQNMSSSFICLTVAGSNEIRLLMSSTRNNPTPLATGQKIFIDSGNDIGLYTIIEVVTDLSPNFVVKVDRILSSSTLATASTYSFIGLAVSGTKLIQDGVLPFTPTGNDWITIFAATNTNILTTGNDVEFIGTFKVSGLGLGFMTIERTVNFPANATVSWILHGPPSKTPIATSGGGTEISTQYVRFRMYDSVLQKRKISIDWAAIPNPLDPTSIDQIILDDPLTIAASTSLFSHKSPYRILRTGERKFSATLMAKNRQSGLYYIDIPVIALGLGDEFAFKENSAFMLDGRRNVYGYTYKPLDENFTFSTKEILDIALPPIVIPVGVTPTADNEIPLTGQNLQFTYDTAPLVEDMQNFFDSPLDRVVNSNPLVRHFLPGYVIVEANYSGGSSTDVVAKDIIDLINSIPSDTNELRVDAITRILQKRSANTISMPIELVALVHGIDRFIRCIRSNNALGIDPPTFKGVNKMFYLIPGKDTSNQDPQPDGEQVFLTRT